MKELSLFDVARLDALKRALLKAPQIIEGPNDFARLSKMVHQGKPRKVREILEKRTSKMVAYWMRKMGSKRGRPRVHRPDDFVLLGIYKRRKNVSWEELAQKVNPELFKDKPSRNKLASAVQRAEKEPKISLDATSYVVTKFVPN